MMIDIPAVIIAAGRGSRLESLHDSKPKTLLPFDNDHRIIDIILESIRKAGISDVIVVIGYRGHVLQDALADGRDHGVNITYVENPDWEKPNGLSVLSASDAVGDREFLLSMSDHLYEPEPVRSLLEFPLSDGGAVVAIDKDIGGVHDINDAMKLRTRKIGRGHLISRMDKSLSEYDSVDCGLFKATTDLFQALQRAAAQGYESLSNGCGELISRSKMFGCDITGNFWIDVDTPDALITARKRWIEDR